jgi:hypothetical protein
MFRTTRYRHLSVFRAYFLSWLNEVHAKIEATSRSTEATITSVRRLSVGAHALFFYPVASLSLLIHIVAMYSYAAVLSSAAGATRQKKSRVHACRVAQCRVRRRPGRLNLSNQVGRSTTPTCT